MTPEERPEPPWQGDERAVLEGFLDFLRATIELKCDGLTDEQARRPLLASSPNLTLLGLLLHLADVERSWFQVVLRGQGEPPRWTEAPDAEYLPRPGETLEVALAAYRAECERSREAARSMALDDVARKPDRPVSVRWVLAHMIEETGRHCGHADLLREAIDGTKGE